MLSRTTISAFAPGRGAVITGGASGIGLATARQLALFGMRVCIADRDQNALQIAAEDLASITRNGADDVLPVQTDVSSAADIDRLAESAFGRFADIALLMNNAAAFQGSDALSDPDGWRRVIDVNLLGVLNGVQRIGRAMIERGKSGFIVNTADEMVEAIGRIDRLSRAECRREFENRFTAEIMVEQYERVYHRLIEEGQRKPFPEVQNGLYHKTVRSPAIDTGSESDL